MSAFSGNIYDRNPNPKQSEEKVVLYESNDPVGDAQVRPTLDDERSRSKIMTRETVKIGEAITTGEM